MQTKILFRFVFIVLLLLSTAIVHAGPKIQKWKLRNGATILFFPAKEIPMVDVRVVFDAAGSRDSKKQGVALLTNVMLPEGAGKLNSDQIAVKLDNIGARISRSSNRDMATVDLRTLSDKQILNKAVNLMSLIVNKPSFPKDAFERERKRILVGIEARKQSPGSVADIAFYSTLYGNHPYGLNPMGTKESVESITIEDMKAHYKKYYVGRNATVAIVGDVSRRQAKQIAKKLVGRLPKGKAAPRIAEVDSLAKASRKVIKHPSTQTHILMGQPGVSRKDPDYFALYVGNHILGGSGLVSRISEEIREKRGLAYSSYSFFLPMASKGPFEMGLQTRGDQTKEALGVLVQTLKKFVETGPSDEELKAAKQNIIGGFALRLNSNSKILSYLAVIGFYDLPLNYLDTFVDKVNAVSRDQIKQAFERRIKPDNMVTVIVGGGVES